MARALWSASIRRAPQPSASSSADGSLAIEAPLGPFTRRGTTTSATRSAFDEAARETRGDAQIRLVRGNTAAAAAVAARCPIPVSTTRRRTLPIRDS